MVFNINPITGPGFFYWTGSEWQEVAANTSPINSTKLETDIYFPNTSWLDIPGGFQLAFTAKKPEALVYFSASGMGASNSMAEVYFHIINITNSSSPVYIGGTNSNQHNSDIGAGYATRAWNVAFSELLTGLQPGSTYTLKIQCLVQGTQGTRTASINASSLPDRHHMTLSVMQ